MEDIGTILNNLWNATVFSADGRTVTVSLLVMLLGSFIGVIVFVSILRRVVVGRLIKKFSVEQGVLYSVSIVVQYIIGTIAFFVILYATGLDISSLTVIFGAFGVGIGFGLQNIVNNLVSGVVILIERHVRVGDRIEVGDVEGDIVSIALRATTVITNEGIAIVVPNAQFITSTVVNRSLQNRRVRFKLPVGVAYASDPDHVRTVLMQAAATHGGVLTDPEPTVIFDKFGDSSLDFFLWVWTETYIKSPIVFRSELNFAIHRALIDAGINIPFPQRELHLGSNPINVKIQP